MENKASLVDAMMAPFDAHNTSERNVTTSRVKRTYEDIERWLRVRIATLSNMEARDVPINQPFADFSLDSSVVVTITNELSKWLGEDLSITLFWEFPTISDLASNLTNS